MSEWIDASVSRTEVVERYVLQLSRGWHSEITRCPGEDPYDWFVEIDNSRFSRGGDDDDDVVDPFFRTCGTSMTLDAAKRHAVMAMDFMKALAHDAGLEIGG